MELELTRVDYTIVGVNENNCMKLLPLDLSSEPTQRIAVADTDGILQIFSIKKEDVQLHFKSLPGHKASSLQLAGAVGTQTDKIFMATLNEVRGFTKKGKLFLSFDTNLTEPITSMFVFGNDLFACGSHSYNHYRDCKDIGSYLCGDKIVDVIALMLEKTHRLISLIACEGRMIRSLEHARITHSIEIESSPTVLAIYRAEDGKKFVLFGTVDGKVGVLDLERSHTFDRWIINDDKNTGSVSSLASYDFTKDGNNNLVVGRNDGNVEVYIINILDRIDRPACIYTYNCNESVTSLQCGIVSTPGFDEIVVSTYTGRIFGLTTEASDRKVGGDSQIGNYILSAETSQKIMKLKAEIESLQETILREREKYQSLTHSFLEEFSAIPTLKIKDSMVLSKAEAAYNLTLEVPTAIDNVLLQSNVLLDLLDAEKNSAVVSYSEADEKCGNYLLATYRCQVNTNRLELRIRSVEGYYGTLQVYITPLIQPKFCQLRKYEIKPLSLHLRIHQFEEVGRPFNTLSVKGSFSLAEVHSWVSNCLNEVPEKPSFTDETVLNFQSTFLGTILQCKYSKGIGHFKSDNVSTISIIKEFISKQANGKNIKFEVSSNLNDDSINHVLQIIDPKFTNFLDLKRKVELIDALHELEVNEDEENSGNYLTKKYRELLAGEKGIREEFKKHPSYQERLNGIISNLYVDYNQFKGVNVKKKLPKLKEILNNYNYDDVLNFLRPNFNA